VDGMAEWGIDVMGIIEAERVARAAQDACMADLRKRGVIR
jgi:hypothetical protein